MTGEENGSDDHGLAVTPLMPSKRCRREPQAPPLLTVTRWGAVYLPQCIAVLLVTLLTYRACGPLCPPLYPHFKSFLSTSMEEDWRAGAAGRNGGSAFSTLPRDRGGAPNASLLQENGCI